MLFMQPTYRVIDDISSAMVNDLPPVVSGFCSCKRTIMGRLLVVALQLCCSSYAATAKSADDWVSLDKTRLVVKQGRTGEATCSRRPGSNGTVTWVDPLGRAVSADNRSRVYQDADGGRLSLAGANATADSGVYVCAFNLTVGCRAEGGGDDSAPPPPRCNATLDCRVYVMPDYLVDGVVVLAVNGILVAVFVACLVHSVVAEKRRPSRHGLQKLYDAH